MILSVLCQLCCNWFINLFYFIGFFFFFLFFSFLFFSFLFFSFFFLFLSFSSHSQNYPAHYEKG